MSKLFTKGIIFIAGALIICAAALIQWFIFTPEGSASSALFFLDKYAGRSNYQFESISGNLSSGVEVSDLVINDLLGLPKGATIQVDTLSMKAWITGVHAEARGGRLKLKGSDTILFNGRVVNGFLSGIDLFGASVSVYDIFSFIPVKGYHNELGGEIKNVQCIASGSMFSPHIEGKMHAEKVFYGSFSVEDAPVVLDLKIKMSPTHSRIKGEVILEGGKLIGPRSSLNLRRCRIIFFGDPEDVNVEAAAYSEIDGYKIDIEINGPVQKPSIGLRSTPHLSEEAILLTIATGKAWRSVTNSIEDGKISSDVAKDFVEFFVFNGSENDLLRSMGIDEVGFTYDDGLGGVVVKKNLTPKAGVKYGYEQEVGSDMPMPNNAVNPSHTLGGSYNITESVSVEGERKSQDLTSITEEGDEKQDTVMLKYKKTF